MKKFFGMVIASMMTLGLVSCSAADDDWIQQLAPIQSLLVQITHCSATHRQPVLR